jgi:hypothetical protein
MVEEASSAHQGTYSNFLNAIRAQTLKTPQGCFGDEGMSCSLRSSLPKRKVTVIASGMDHVLRKIARVSFIERYKKPLMNLLSQLMLSTLRREQVLNSGRQLPKWLSEISRVRVNRHLTTRLSASIFIFCAVLSW